MSRSRVALIHGHDRFDNIRRALALIEDDVDLSLKRKVVVKPNFVATRAPAAVTHPDATRAVLEFLRSRYNGPIVIAEGPSSEPASRAFSLFGYDRLAQDYGAQLLDLNHDDTVPVDVYDWRLRPMRLNLARTVVDSDFRVSVGPPKTHDVVVVTLSLKNMVMGSLISRLSHNQPQITSGAKQRRGLLATVRRFLPGWFLRLSPVEWLQLRAMSLLLPSDKMKMHQSHAVLNLNLALIAPKVVPHLSVIDGFEAMEGNGPTEGSVVPLHLGLAGTDALATDAVAAALMGFDVESIGYLSYVAQMGLGRGLLSEIQVVGNTTVAEQARVFRPHDSYQRQLEWHWPKAANLLPQR